MFCFFNVSIRMVCESFWTLIAALKKISHLQNILKSLWPQNVGSSELANVSNRVLLEKKLLRTY